LDLHDPSTGAGGKRGTRGDPRGKQGDGGGVSETKKSGVLKDHKTHPQPRHPNWWAGVRRKRGQKNRWGEVYRDPRCGAGPGARGGGAVGR